MQNWAVSSILVQLKHVELETGKIGMIELLQGDCMDYMRDLPDNAFDICITSPPYNMNLRVNAKGDGYCSRQIVRELSTKYSNYDDNLPMADYEEFLVSVMYELVRISNLTFLNIQVVTGNKPAVFKAFGRMADSIKELMVWDKTNSEPAIGFGVLNSEFELIIVLGDKPITRAFQNPKFGRGTLSNIIRIGKSKGNGANHKAAFPIQIPELILRSFAEPGYKVFDPFLGTGTTAIAAHNYSCDFVGIELDEDYYKAAKERFDRETSQGALF